MCFILCSWNGRSREESCRSVLLEWRWHIEFSHLWIVLFTAQNSNVELGHCRWRKFADGFPDLFVENATSIRNKHVAFLASFHNPSVIFEQMSVIYALPRLFVGSFTLVLPFFPTGTLERVRLRPTCKGNACDCHDLTRVQYYLIPLHSALLTLPSARTYDSFSIMLTGGDWGWCCNSFHLGTHPHKRPALQRRPYQPGNIWHPCTSGKRQKASNIWL
jgi:hypothetical protein